MGTLKWFMLYALLGYGALVALLYVTQRSIQYFPERFRTAPAAAGLPQAQEVVLDTADGERVIVWHVPPRGNKPVVLYFHGNGGALRNRVGRFRALIANGNGLVALSYRGYGGPTGSPTEAGLIAARRRPMRSPRRAIPPSGSCYGVSLSAPASRLRSAPVIGLAASCWKGPLPRLPMWGRARIGFCRCGF